MSTVLAAAMAGGGTASAITSSLAQYQAGQFAKTAAIRQSEMLENQAKQTQAQAGADIAAQDVQATQVLNAQIAKTAASGITTEGSPAMMFGASEEEAQLNDMYTKYAANMKANSLYYQGTMGKIQGRQEADASTIGAITSGISGTISSGIDAYALKSKLG